MKAAVSKSYLKDESVEGCQLANRKRLRKWLEGCVALRCWRCLADAKTDLLADLKTQGCEDELEWLQCQL